ncbi:hypothetical protein LJR039_007581 [Pseudorhodoferax sp. LjRoot39]|uniref:hypothetical protein n=1 Tax=Pseudorhodoferax sp. LjRoot39 TaxID=3342328 RepID=UPI003ECCC49F
MTISLPWFWTLGHLAALVGMAMAGLHVYTRPRAGVIAGLLGGVLSAAWLAYILAEIEQSFFGVYRWLAWIVAFFAGYACGAGVVPLARSLWGLRGR